MNIYLPLAETSVNALLIILMGAGVGFLSGMLGVGGGFIMTPLLIFAGIPPAVAVSTEASQITASSVSGFLTHWRRRAVDLKMGGILIAGGIFGSTIGVEVFRRFTAAGQVDVLISLLYIVFLTLIGSLMLAESLTALRRVQRGEPPPPRPKGRSFVQRMPWRTRFPRSGLYISVIPPFALGALTGVLAAIMGIGGGFILVPGMIYLLRMPTNVVIGTSLVQILVVSALVTVLQATRTQTVDIVLAVLLIFGGVLGAQFGARAGTNLKGEQLRMLLAILVLGMGLKLLVDLILTPPELFDMRLG
jgi:uncharacterized protein